MTLGDVIDAIRYLISIIESTCMSVEEDIKNEIKHPMPISDSEPYLSSSSIDFLVLENIELRHNSPTDIRKPWIITIVHSSQYHNLCKMTASNCVLDPNYSTLEPVLVAVYLEDDMVYSLIKTTLLQKDVLPLLNYCDNIQYYLLSFYGIDFIVYVD